MEARLNYKSLDRTLRGFEGLRNRFHLFGHTNHVQTGSSEVASSSSSTNDKRSIDLHSASSTSASSGGNKPDLKQNIKSTASSSSGARTKRNKSGTTSHAKYDGGEQGQELEDEDHFVPTRTPPMPILGAARVRAWMEFSAPKYERGPAPKEVGRTLVELQSKGEILHMTEEYPFLQSESLKVLTRIRTADTGLFEYCDLWAVAQMALIVARSFAPYLLLLGVFWFDFGFWGGPGARYLFGEDLEGLNWILKFFFSDSVASFLVSVFCGGSIFNYFFVYIWAADRERWIPLETIDEKFATTTRDAVRRGREKCREGVHYGPAKILSSSKGAQTSPARNVPSPSKKKGGAGGGRAGGGSPYGGGSTTATETDDMEVFRSQWRPPIYTPPFWVRMNKFLGLHTGDIDTAMPFGLYPEIEQELYNWRCWVRVEPSDTILGKDGADEACACDWSFPDAALDQVQVQQQNNQHSSASSKSSSTAQEQKKKLLAGGPMGLIIVLTGVNGASRERYVLDLIRQAHRKGYAVCVAGNRGFGGTPLQGDVTYHSARSADIRKISLHVATLWRALAAGQPEKYDANAIFGVGFSIGGSILGMLLSEPGFAEVNPFRAVVSLGGTPNAGLVLHPQRASRLWHSCIACFCAAWLRPIRETIEKFPGCNFTKGGGFGCNILDMESWVNAPYGGFGGGKGGIAAAVPYYNKLKCVPENLPCPFLWCMSIDDPIVAIEGACDTLVSDKPHRSIIYITETGGHIGYPTNWPFRKTTEDYWRWHGALLFSGGGEDDGGNAEGFFTFCRRVAGGTTVGGAGASPASSSLSTTNSTSALLGTTLETKGGEAAEEVYASPDETRKNNNEESSSKQL